MDKDNKSKFKFNCLSDLPAVGPKILANLNERGIIHIEDLVWHLPLHYIDKTKLTPIHLLKPYTKAYFVGNILKVETLYNPRKTLKCTVQCPETGAVILLRFFYFSKFQAQKMHMGDQIACFGEIRAIGNHLEIAHPEYTLLDPDESPPLETTLTPNYPNIPGLGAKRLRTLIQMSFEYIQSHQKLKSYLPFSEINLIDLDLITALKHIHFPESNASPQALEHLKNHTSIYHQRLALEELVAHRLSLIKLKQQHQSISAPEFKYKSKLNYTEILLNSLPFKLTDSQNKVFQEIQSDLEKPYPMQRLLQGDVGSGKTIISFLASLIAIDHNYQAVIMAPTEILAEQHYQSAVDYFKQFKIPIQTDLLISKIPASEKRKRLEAIQTGQSQLIIGTHALLQDQTVFYKLGLVILDEQHRFGVKQRKALLDKTQHYSPHALMMSATPIPRTLSMTVYADMNISSINELPPGRKPIETRLFSQLKKPEILEKIKIQLLDNSPDSLEQLYWVCPLITESESLNCQAAEEIYKQLIDYFKPFKINIGLVHGQLKSLDKQSIMNDFIDKKIQILVATTVIEVGVNVPDASLMVIENPERLGLAQLHQLRGRVGRGHKSSYCFLLYQSPLSKTAQSRLNVIRESQDGFKIAEEDLKIRGPGEYLGTRQTGQIIFKMADLEKHQNLISTAKQLSQIIIQKYPDYTQPLIQRWIGDKINLGNI